MAMASLTMEQLECIVTAVPQSCSYLLSETAEAALLVLSTGEPGDAAATEAHGGLRVPKF